jgi:hypothetical protein
MSDKHEYLAGWLAGTLAGAGLGLLALGALVLLKLGF